MNKYPPSGVLFENNSTHPKAPHMSGNLEITQEVLRDLVDRANKGEAIKMQLTAYRNSHPTKGEYLRLTAKIDQPWTPNKQQGGFRGNARPTNAVSRPAQQQQLELNNDSPDDDVPF